MATISRESLEALEWMLSDNEGKDARIEELEEELELALEENAALKLQITRLMSDRSVSV